MAPLVPFRFYLIPSRDAASFEPEPGLAAAAPIAAARPRRSVTRSLPAMAVSSAIAAFLLAAGGATPQEPARETAPVQADSTARIGHAGDLLQVLWEIDTGG